jgi:hypothetical protein
MRFTPTIAGLLVLSALAPQVLQAAESSNAGAVSTEAADQTGLNKGTKIIEKSPIDGSKLQLETAKLEGCKFQFKLADLNGDGVLDQKEIEHYNSSIRSEKQPVLPDDDRLNEAGFIAACGAVGAHE